MIDIRFDADLSAWLRAFGNIDRALADASPAHEKIGDFLVGEARTNIIDEGGADPWPALSPVTLARRRISHPNSGEKPLYVTLALFKSLTKDVQRDHVDVGSSLRYARTQFYGRGRIPRRSPFSWRRGVMEEVGAIYLHHCFGQLA